jgi:hypothetical protein
MCRQAKENLKDASMDGESSLLPSASCAARVVCLLVLSSKFRMAGGEDEVPS